MQRLYGPNDRATIEAEEGLAITLTSQGSVEKVRAALQVMQRVHVLKVKFLGRDDPDTLYTRVYMTNALKKLGKYAEAEALCRENVTSLRRLHGDSHIEVFESRIQLANCLGLQDKKSDAAEIYREILPLATRLLGSSHPLPSFVSKALELTGC